MTELADSHPGTPAVSVVVVARDGFARAPAQLLRLLQSTSSPFRLIYVDGGAPHWISRKLQKIVVANNGTLIKSNRFLRPTHARNLGFREVDTPYTVFVDNDVIVADGWLEALVDCAEAVQADYVSPVVTQTLGGLLQIHIAGGNNRLVAAPRGAKFEEKYAHMHRSYADVAAGLVREEVSMAEFHAMLVRTKTLRKLGGLDECCSTAFEHNDFCLSVARLGGKGWLEPSAMVDYAPIPAGLYGNFSYCLLRWSSAWIRESHLGFCAKWGVQPSDAVFQDDLRSLHSRRRRPVRYLRAAVRRIGGHAAMTWLDEWADWFIENLLRRFHERRGLRITTLR